ncbi:MAG TPA: ABC transporter permease [Tepidisphaeraceae bacterium]|nr:ABC transporter permease [Tepidisphaeraceae bacterium]
MRTRSALLSRMLPPLVPLGLAGVLAELLVPTDRYSVVPTPSSVARALASESDLWAATAQTAIASVAGFAFSAVVGILFAVALSSSRWVERALYPYAVLFQTVPIIAIAPMLVIWIGFGMPTVITSAFIVSVFPVIASTVSGLRSTDPALLDLFRLYGAGRTTSLLKLRLPFALPSILTGLRVAAGLSVIGAIVGEFITGGGLGSIIDASRTQQRVDKVFAVLILASGLGMGLFGIVNLISWLTLRHWHASEKLD